jgi:hypothetical protein
VKPLKQPEEKNYTRHSLSILSLPSNHLIMQQITDEYMLQMLATTKAYTLVILKRGPNMQRQDAKQIIWEHGRNNFKLRAEGLLSIVCPVIQESEIAGIGIFNADPNTVEERLKEDAAIKEGVLIYEFLRTKSFPGDSLPV